MTAAVQGLLPNLGASLHGSVIWAGNLICWIGILTCQGTHIQFFLHTNVPKCQYIIIIYYILHIINEGDSMKTRGISPPVVPCWKTKRWHDEEGRPSSPFRKTKGRHHEVGTPCWKPVEKKGTTRQGAYPSHHVEKKWHKMVRRTSHLSSPCCLAGAVIFVVGLVVVGTKRAAVVAVDSTQSKPSELSVHTRFWGLCNIAEGEVGLPSLRARKWHGHMT